MADWTPPPFIPHDGQSDYYKKFDVERRKLSYLTSIGDGDIPYDTHLSIIRNHIAKKSQIGQPLSILSEADIQDLAQRSTVNAHNNSKLLAKSRAELDAKFPMSKIDEIGTKWAKKARGQVLTNLSPADRAKYDAEIAKFKKGRADAEWNTGKYKKDIERQLYEHDFDHQLRTLHPDQREQFIADEVKRIKADQKAYTGGGYTDPAEAEAHRLKLVAADDAELKHIETVAKKFQNPAGSYTGESRVEVAVKKAKAGLATATDKTKKAGSAVGGAVKKAVTAVLPAQGPVVPPPSPLVRPVTAAPAPTPVASKPATPVPAGLPPPPSAAIPATPTVPVVPLPSAAQQAAQGSTAPTASGLTLQKGRAFTPVDDAQAQLARLNGAGGVSGVSRDGIQVQETSEEFIARTKGTSKEGIHKVNLKSLPRASYEPTVRIEAQPVDPAIIAKNATRRAQLELQAKTGKMPPKSGVSLQLEEGGTLLDIAKRQLPTVFKVGDAIANIGGPSAEQRAATERFKAEQKVKADAKAALADLERNPVSVKPEKVFYNPQSGREGAISPEATPAQGRALMSSFRDRLTKTLYSDILPYARGGPMKAEIAKLFGQGATQRSFLERALQRSGRFTPEEIQVAWRSIMNNPDAMATLTPAIGHLPAEGQPLPNQPLPSGGAPKPLPQRPTGNSLPLVTPIEETARDRLAAQRQLQAEAQALAQAEARAAQEAEFLRIAAEEKAAFDLNKHNVLVERARKADEAAQALIAKNIKDEIRARSPAGTEDAWEGTPFYSNSTKTNFFPATSGVTRLDRLRQIAVENKRGVNPLEIKLARLTGGQPNTNLYGDLMGRTLRSGQAPPSAGARVAGQVGNVGAQSVGFLPDIMTAYALSRGGPITPDGRVLYPSEVTTTPDNATFETEALQGLARYHPDNADRNPDVTHRDRFNYHPQWYKDETDARNQDIAEFVKQTGFNPEPMRGSQQVPQAILDAIRSQR